ncbi:MAG: HlyD family efflux transporter periplasmic adaptor subunit [Planctomycetota bacterium]|nr:MAG: HlyD family efflux transporter periplasmic adaptor subunit [Planctomycetota bacterium]
MSAGGQPIDLAALARPAAPARQPAAQAGPPRRRRLGLWIVLALVLAFGALLAWSLTDVLRGARDVTVVRPRVASDGALAGASGRASSGAPLLQAAGWIEPDPFPIQVSARVPGVVTEMLVRESDRVTAGQVVARLASDTYQIECDLADATLANARAELAAALAERTAAQANWDQALAVTEALAKARADEAGRRGEAQLRSAAIDEARAGERLARGELELQRELAARASTGARQVELAEARHAEATARIARMEAEASVARASHEQARAVLARAETEAKLRIEDRARLDGAIARAAAADARVAEVAQMCARTKLHLAHTAITAPTDGVVLERLAMPGTALDAGDAGAPVLTLYDPASLRVRVDVAQGEIGKLAVGQRVEIANEARAGRPYRGEVVRVVQKADIQKVTLQVHVRVLDPDELLRPEMLCQARFFAAPVASSASQPGAAADGAAASGDGALEIPRRLLDADGAVWIVGGDGTALRRRIEASGDGEWVRVESGLLRSDKVIDEGRAGLVDGARVRVGREE